MNADRSESVKVLFPADLAATLKAEARRSRVSVADLLRQFCEDSKSKNAVAKSARKPTAS